MISASAAPSPRLGFRTGLLLFAGYTAISAILLWPWPSVMATSGIRLGGASPLLAHNLTLFIAFPLCGLGAALLAYELFRSRAGAVLAGMTFAFSPYRWDDFIHLQLLSLQWLPLTLWSLVRFERERRPATLGAVFVFAALLAGSSGYWAVLAAMAGGVTLLHFLVRKKSRGAVLGTADFGDDLVWGIDRKGRVVDEVPGWPKRLYSRASSGWDGLR